jgi:hypothetical protein
MKIKYQQPLLHFFNNSQSLAYCENGSSATRDPSHGYNCTNGPLPGDPYCANGSADDEALYTCKNGTGVIQVNSCNSGTSPQLP